MPRLRNARPAKSPVSMVSKIKMDTSQPRHPCAHEQKLLTLLKGRETVGHQRKPAPQAGLIQIALVSNGVQCSKSQANTTPTGATRPASASAKHSPAPAPPSFTSPNKRNSPTQNQTARPHDCRGTTRPLASSQAKTLHRGHRSQSPYRPSRSSRQAASPPPISSTSPQTGHGTRPRPRSSSSTRSAPRSDGYGRSTALPSSITRSRKSPRTARATSRPPQRKSKPSKPRPAPRSSSTYSSAPISRSAAAQRLASPRQTTTPRREPSHSPPKRAPRSPSQSPQKSRPSSPTVEWTPPNRSRRNSAASGKSAAKVTPWTTPTPTPCRCSDANSAPSPPRLGFQKRIVSHDLRRTAALRIHALTGDVTAVQALLGHSSLQSTIWYLDHDLKSISAATLEAMKKPFKPFRRRNSQ